MRKPASPVPVARKLPSADGPGECRPDRQAPKIEEATAGEREIRVAFQETKVSDVAAHPNKLVDQHVGAPTNIHTHLRSAHGGTAIAHAGACPQQAPAAAHVGTDK